MNDKLETNNKNESLDGDDDVLLFNQATFTVGRFKELVAREFSKILEIPLEKKSEKKSDSWGSEPTMSMSTMSISTRMRELQINEETKIMAGDIKWNSPKEGIDCQVLKIGSKGWQKGKVQIEVNKNIKSGEAQTSIKFCPDEPLEPKSPLDDIRQSEEYKKLSNNN